MEMGEMSKRTKFLYAIIFLSIFYLFAFNCYAETKEELINEGNEYMQQQRYVEAVDVFNKAIKLDPNNANAYFSRARDYFLQRDFDEATQDVNKAKTLQKEPNENQLEIIKTVESVQKVS